MISIKISNHIVGEEWLFEKLYRKGRMCKVPTYGATMNIWNKPEIEFRFAVTRDASDVVFGISPDTERYGPKTECPPSKPDSSYRAVLHDVNDDIPFALRLYEPQYRNQYHLLGQGSTVRSAILIHHGPARTEGCFTIAGGKLGFARFRRQFNQEWKMRVDDTICVEVAPRPETDLIRPSG